MVFVNGVPHGGDIYRSGWLLPSGEAEQRPERRY